MKGSGIITASEIKDMEGLAKVHFLNPDARRLNKSLGDMAGITGFGFHIIEVEPGCLTTEYHVHHHEDECVFVLSGSATARIGDERFPIGEGDFIAHPKGGEAHAIENTGRQVLRLIVVGERRDHDVGDYPDKGKRIFRNAGLPWTVVEHEYLEEVSAGAKR